MTSPCIAALAFVMDQNSFRVDHMPKSLLSETQTEINIVEFNW